MSTGEAKLVIAGSAFTPGERISGDALWKLSTSPREVVLRLFWHTKGKGTRDSETVWEQAFEAPLSDEQRNFSVEAPAFPPSFSGDLISLLWSIELVIDGSGMAVAEIVIAPNGTEVNLQREEWLAMEAPWDKPKIPWIKSR
ncbi:MAG: hypothetical protein ACREKL_16290 [Chthoniobacterales bacterium]